MHRAGPERVRHPQAQPATLEGRPRGCRQPGYLGPRRLRPDRTCWRAECPAHRSPSPAGSSARRTSATYSPGPSNCAALSARAGCCWRTSAGCRCTRFAAYRQHVLDRLAELGYAADWRLLHASDYGVPQLRPRFVLVAMRPDDFAYFTWPEPHGEPPTVGETLRELMAANGWPGAARMGRESQRHRSHDRRRVEEAWRRRPWPYPRQARLAGDGRGRARSSRRRTFGG